MMRKYFGAMLVAALVTVSAQTAAAQGGFQPGHLDIGPTLGLGGIGEAGMAIGARAEKAIKTLPSMGDGVLGIQLGGEYYSYDCCGGYSWSYMPIGATANYHFKMTDTKFDPFIGVGLGFQIVSCDYPGIGVDLCEDSSLYFIGRAGARYFLSEKMAAYADIGAGASTLSIGLMFKLK